MRHTTRREALRKGAAGLAAGSLASLSATATATADEDDPDGPHSVAGTRTRELELVDGLTDLVEDVSGVTGVYDQTVRFESDELAATYGVEELVYDGDPVAATVPDPEDVVFDYEDTAVVGRFVGHARDERGEDGVADGVGYEGPLYVYAAEEDDPDEDDVAERTGPVNVGWRDALGKDAADVDAHMEERGWVPWVGAELYEPGDRYVVYDTADGDTAIERQAADVEREVDGSEQWHARLYDVGDTAADDGVLVCGQAHRDPDDHGHMDPDPDWKFAASREEVRDDWAAWGSNTVTGDADNGDDFETSNGWFSAVGE